MKFTLFAFAAVLALALATAKKVDLKHATASQSSTWRGGVPSRAVDGNLDSHYWNGSCTHTNIEHGALWIVDLGECYDITSVQITNRGDCCSTRLANFDVFVGNTLCAYQKEALQSGETRDLKCDTTTRGNFVTIQLRGKNYLTLCEVQVFGTPCKTTGKEIQPVPLRGEEASQSSVYGHGVPSLAVDGKAGILDSHNWKYSCTRTKYQKGAWWKVNLGECYDITSVQITNRGDCCWNRLANFVVWVDEKICAEQKEALQSGETRDLKCDTTTRGKSVKIQLNGANYLTLCEVKVFGQKCN